jgi:predicted membrane protein
MYDKTMNRQTTTRIITGSIVLLAGIGALLDALHLFPFWGYFSDWWPLILILAGVVIFINDFKQYIVALAFILGGTILQLHHLDIIEVNVWGLLWPIILIAVGLSIVVNRSTSPKSIKTQDFDTTTAIFGGSEVVNSSKEYQGGKATAVFGGVSIDLRDATIKKEATLEVFALCGGIEIRVPREWKVQHQVFPILGGIESKKHGEKAKDAAPVLIITGTVALGGVEVRS